MKIDRRIWKTAAAAAAITLVASAAIMRLDDWSKGLNSGFIVYGQSGTGGGGGSTGTGGGTTYTKALPQIVSGGGYATTIEVINTSSTTESVSAVFYNTSDGSASTLKYSTNLNAPTSFTGSMPPISLPANNALVLTTSSSSPGVNWGVVTASGTITVAEVFEVRDNNNNLQARVGVPGSPANMQKIVIPRFRNFIRGSLTGFSGLDVGYALANTGSTDITVTVAITDALGNTLQISQPFKLAAHTQIAEFPAARFPSLADQAGLTYGAVTITASAPQLAAIGLADEFATSLLSTFPVDVLQ